MLSSARDIINSALGDDKKLLGWPIYSGEDSIRRGDLYVLGYNPADDDANVVIEFASYHPSRWSAYTHQCCKCGRDQCSHKNSQWLVLEQHKKPFQRRMSELFSSINIKPEDAFATNAILWRADLSKI